MLITIADYISTFPFVINFGFFYSFLLNPNQNILDLLFIIFILLADISVCCLKQIKYPSFLYHITRRPKGASNTDYFCRNGIRKYGTPGFPSGHMTTMSFFGVFMILVKWKNYLGTPKQFIKDNIYFISLNIFLIVITGWARYYKKCHNIFQIIGGTILGSTYAYLLYYFLYKVVRTKHKFGIERLFN